MIDYKATAKPRTKTPDGCAVYCNYDKILPIAELRPNPANPNGHGDKQVRLLADIIKSTGWRAPITVSRRSGLIVKGHGRRMAAMSAGLEYAPVEYQDYSSDAEEKADLMADNRIAELAEMDDDKLEALLKEVKTDIPIELTGYSERDLLQMIGAEGPEVEDDGADTEEEDNGPTFTRYGDLWHLGRHRLLCGSATSGDDIARLMGDDRAQLVHTDPPYGVAYIDQSGRFGMIKNDQHQGDDLLQKLLIPAFKNYVKYTTDNAAIYIWYAARSVRDFLDAMDAAGIEWVQRIVWVKNQFVLGHEDYEWNDEPCFYARKSGGKKPPFYGDRSQTTSWKVTARDASAMATVLTGGIMITDGKGGTLYVTERKPKGKKCRAIRLHDGRSVYLQNPNAQTTTWTVDKDPHIEHPNQKPIELPARAIRNSTKEGDLVIDFFGGSGSTLLAAEMENRRCYSTELDPKYCDLIVKRYVDMTGDRGVYAERGRGRVTYDDMEKYKAEGTKGKKKEKK